MLRQRRRSAHRAHTHPRRFLRRPNPDHPPHAAPAARTPIHQLPGSAPLVPARRAVQRIGMLFPVQIKRELARMPSLWEIPIIASQIPSQIANKCAIKVHPILIHQRHITTLALNLQAGLFGLFISKVVHKSPAIQTQKPIISSKESGQRSQGPRARSTRVCQSNPRSATPLLRHTDFFLSSFIGSRRHPLKPPKTNLFSDFPPPPIQSHPHTSHPQHPPSSAHQSGQ